MSEKCSCSCGSGGECTTLIYSCSGAANTGYLADAAARNLMKDGAGKMTCLSAVGADLSGFVESAKGAKNVVIDGCPVSCGKKIFENAGLPYEQIIVTDLGVEKGETVIDEKVISNVTKSICEKIGN